MKTRAEQEAEATRQLIRAGLWALFATGGMACPGVLPEDAGGYADRLLKEFEQRFGKLLNDIGKIGAA